MTFERVHRYIRRSHRQMHAIRILRNKQRDERAKRRERNRHINQIKDKARLLQDQRILQRLQELNERFGNIVMV